MDRKGVASGVGTNRRERGIRPSSESATRGTASVIAKEFVKTAREEGVKLMESDVFKFCFLKKNQIRGR